MMIENIQRVKVRCFSVLPAALLLVLLSPIPSRAQDIEWVRQFDLTFSSGITGISTDEFGDAYITGYTQGNRRGVNVGKEDAFITKFDSMGTLLWTQLLRTSEVDWSLGVSADGLGNVYMSGYTFGDLERTNPGGSSAFVTKYDDTGVFQWTRQIDRGKSRGVAADSLGNVFIAGEIGEFTDGNVSFGGGSFVSMFNADGVMQWAQRISTEKAYLTEDISADGLGNVYVTGRTPDGQDGGNEGSFDAFVSKINSSGTVEWIRELGTDIHDRSMDDKAFGVSADGLGNVYITGHTFGSLGGVNAGGRDAFISKYDADGELRWTEQLGSLEEDYGRSISADGIGGVYVSGGTSGNLGGNNVGESDVFISKYNSDGSQEWTRQLGSGANDFGRGIAVGNLGDVYVTGFTGRNLGWPGSGSGRLFLAKYIPGSLTADFDGDGVVGLNDFAILKSHFGQNGGKEDGNADGRGKIDLNDFRLLKEEFGKSAAVPEPSSLLLTTVACAMVVLLMRVRGSYARRLGSHR